MCIEKNSTDYYNSELTIWIVKLSEQNPGENKRLERAGSLAEYLSHNGYKVVWWKSSFSHQEKKYTVSRLLRRVINKNEEIVFLHCDKAYTKNRSISRLVYYKRIASLFKKKISEEKNRPDLIFCAWPPAEMAQVSVEYGKKYGIPVIIDCRDEWPDAFEGIGNGFVNLLIRFAIIPLKIKAKRIFSNASGITGVAEDSLRWGCSYAGRTPDKRDRVIFIGNQELNYKDERYLDEITNWGKIGVSNNTWNLCFFGTLSQQTLDIETCINAVIELSKDYENIRFIIGGTGDMDKYLRKKYSRYPCIIFTGFLNEIQMNSLMMISKCGVYSLKNAGFFRNAISNKAIQYMSAGIPILTSLSGYMKQLIEDEDIGLYYLEGDIDDCKEKIRLLYLNRELQKSQCKKSKEIFMQTFNSDTINSQFDEYFRSIIGQANYNSN